MEGLTPFTLFVFAAFKYAFYVLAAIWLNYWYGTPGTVKPTTFAAIRTGLGLVLGLGLLSGLRYFGRVPDGVEVALIILGRFIAWWILLVVFYDRTFRSVGKTLATALLGVVYSASLDVPAMLVGIIARVTPIC